MSVAFGQSDHLVCVALDLAADSDGLATFGEICRYLPHLPVQRLTGMERRGLLWFNGREWAITAKGREQWGAYR